MEGLINTNWQGSKEEAFNLEIFPNPFTQVLYLILGNLKRQKFCLEIIDTQNKVMVSKHIPGHVSLNKMTLPVEDLEKGSYTVRISYGNKVMTKKIKK